MAQGKCSLPFNEIPLKSVDLLNWVIVICITMKNDADDLLVEGPRVSMPCHENMLLGGGGVPIFPWLCNMPSCLYL